MEGSVERFERNIRDLYRREDLNREKSLAGYKSDPLFHEIPEEIRKLSLGLWHPARHASLKNEPQKILDIGCGGGFDLYYLFRKYPRASFFGADLSPELLQQGLSILNRFGFSPSLLNANAREIPFPDASIDFILAHAVIHLSQDREVIFRDLRRILSKTGQVLVCEPVIRGELPSILKEEYQKSGGIFLFGGLARLEDYQLWASTAGFSYFDLLEQVPFSPEKEILQLIEKKHGQEKAALLDLSGIEFSIAVFSLSGSWNWGLRKILCPSCGVETLYRYRSTIDIRDKGMREMLLGDRLNFSRCEACGAFIDCPEAFLCTGGCRGIIINKLPGSYHEMGFSFSALAEKFPSLKFQTVHDAGEFKGLIRKKWWQIW